MSIFFNPKDSTSFFTVRVARTKQGELIYLDADEDWYTEEEGLDVVNDLLGGTNPYEMYGEELIPEERGLYECKVEYACWQSGHPLDPVEWDTSSEIVEVKKL